MITKILYYRIRWLAICIGEECVRLLRCMGYSVTWDYFEGVVIESEK